MSAEWLQLLNTFGLLAVAVISWWSNRQTHKLVNSRMTELLELTRKAARAEGALDKKERKND